MKFKKYNMASIKKYFGITFGPIDRVLSYAKSTRSIWASSYFFSDLAKRIVEPLFNAGCRFLKPSVDRDMFESSCVGKFPDQYVLEGTDEINSIEVLRGICDNVLCNVGKRMISCLGLDMNEEQMFDYLRHKVKIYITELESDKKESDVVEVVQDVLSCSECRDVFPDIECDNYLAMLFEKNIPDLRSFFELTSLMGFNSLPEVSSHHYVAFVKADGDNFGKNLALNKGLSDHFQTFGERLRESVEDYGGQVIYQGGDDISFYAPLYNGKEDIFCLLSGLDNELVKCLNGVNITDNVPSLSYGVAISYEKHPMAETRQRAEELLKNAKDKQGKNCIVWELRKHSGQTSSGVIKKRPDNERLFVAIIDLIARSFSETQMFLHSLTFWLKRHEQTLRYILSQDNKETLLGNFVKNNFNESIHDQHKAYFDRIKQMLCMESDNNAPNDSIDYMHDLLRYVEHLVSVVNNG